MALKAKITKEEHSKLQQPLQGEYVEKDGAMILQVEGVDGYALEDVTGLKAALGAERTRVGELEKLTAAFKDLDPAKARQAMKQVAELANAKPDDKHKAELEAIKQQLAEKHTNEISAREAELKALTEQITDTLRDQTARVAIKAAGATEAGAELLFHKVRERVRVEKNSAGKFVAIVVDDKGNPQITNRSGSQDVMGIAELVETFKKPFAVCFQGSGATGGGATGTGGPGQGGSNNNQTLDPKLSAAEQLRTARSIVGSQRS